MRRGATIWLATSVAVLGVASIAAASSSIEQPARVDDRALRLSPTLEPELTPEERAIVELVTYVNIERGNRGLPFLLLDEQASAAARGHAAEMAATRRMRHLGADGSDGGIRLTRSGYEWESWGENIGAGFQDPLTLVTSWMNSRDHRFNLLGDFTDIGVGVVATPDGVPYWSLLVARRPYRP